MSGGGAPKSIAVTIDNYRSVNDGEGLNVSDHSPVYGTFVLRLRHNFDKILEDSAHNKSTGNINTVLSALSQSNDGAKTVEFPVERNAGLVTPPRPKNNSNNRYSTGATDPTSKRSNLSNMLHKTVITDTSSSHTNNNAVTSVPRVLKYSLLPPGVYRIRISNMKLIWGMNEEAPSSVSLLFPAPYEVCVLDFCLRLCF